MVAIAARCALPLELEAQAERIVAALQQQAVQFSAMGAAPRIELSAARFTSMVDPASQMPGYEGTWRNARNERCGSITFNSDGSFYAEFDLFCPHPDDMRWFVEMVTVWGRGDVLRHEANLIPSIG